jgi:ParB family chromosome partitioning protein
MNAITHPEVEAINPVSVIPAQPAQHMLLVPLSCLRPSRRNVRKTAGPSIEALGRQHRARGPAAEPHRHPGMRTESTTRSWPEAAACAALQAAGQEAPPRQGLGGALPAGGRCVSARTASLTENLQREAMHPADQFEAFAALVAEGRPIEDIAADFGVTPLVVQRRLKLANVSQRLMADYRADEVSLDQLMALAVTDDHSAQEAAFYASPEWQRGPQALRDRLTEREINARHALVRFVGLAAYEQAGGAIRRDLFAEDDEGVYLADAALLERLVREKLELHAEEVRTEGWAWVEAVPHLSHAERQVFHPAPRQRREPTRREVRRMEVLQGRIDRTDAALEDAYGAEDEDKAEALHQRREALVAELEALQSALVGHAPEVRAMAGAILTVDREGQAMVHRGLLREAEAKALRTLEKLRQGGAGQGAEGTIAGNGDDAAPEAAHGVSDRLAQRLSAHRTAALQIELARQPQVALAALVHGMVRQVLQGPLHGQGLPLGVRLEVQDRLATLAPDVPQSPAAVALHELRQAWASVLPKDGDALFAVLQAMPQEELLRLLAVCAAASVNVVTPSATHQPPGAALARAVGLDMAAWWKPTAEGYFRHVPKAAILEAVGQFAPEQVSRLAKLKKTEIADEAERLVEGAGWMPAVFDAEGVRTAAQEGSPAADGDAGMDG